MSTENTSTTHRIKILNEYDMAFIVLAKMISDNILPILFQVTASNPRFSTDLQDLRFYRLSLSLLS